MLLALQLIKMSFSRPENGIFFLYKCSAFNINPHYATSGFVFPAQRVGACERTKRVGENNYDVASPNGKKVHHL
jgi:hypothetical protein